MWFWFDKIEGQWIRVSELDDRSIETEYQAELAKTRLGQLVYHCFGDSSTACIDFNKMKTYCGSAKCMLTHKTREIPNCHISFTSNEINFVI